MSRTQYINFGLIAKYPNKYGFTPKNINTVKVLDWNWIKSNFSRNLAKDKDGKCWDKFLETKGHSGWWDSEDSFYIAFWEDGRVESKFYSYGGMCGYEFEEFYKADGIENKIDMDIQVKVIKLLNSMVDEKVISEPKKED